MSKYLHPYPISQVKIRMHSYKLYDYNIDQVVNVEAYSPEEAVVRYAKYDFKEVDPIYPEVYEGSVCVKNINYKIKFREFMKNGRPDFIIEKE